MTTVKITALQPAWKTANNIWPVRDVNGNWLILADVERRARAGGGYEYRAAIEGMAA